MVFFHLEQIDFRLKNKTALKKWINSVIETKNKATGTINFIFCSDNYLLDINKQYLQHHTLTDVITFDYSDSSKKIINGDIFISIERITENAGIFSKTTNDELHRVMIHGILHLLGYKDKTKKDKEEMTKQENYYLKKRDFLKK